MTSCFAKFVKIYPLKISTYRVPAIQYSIVSDSALKLTTKYSKEKQEQWHNEPQWSPEDILVEYT